MAFLQTKYSQPLSPLSPTSKNAGSIFSSVSPNEKFFGSRSRSPSEQRSQISIRIDPAEDQLSGFGSPSPRSNDLKISTPKHHASKGNTRMSRRDRETDTKLKKSVNTYEYDRVLIRRQQAMIAVQPMTGIEEIDYKRALLRMKVERRKQFELFEGKNNKAPNNLGTPSPTRISKSQPSSRTPSPSTNAKKKSVPGKDDFQIAKRLAESTSQASKVTKKIVNQKSVNPQKRLPPKISITKSHQSLPPKGTAVMKSLSVKSK